MAVLGSIDQLDNWLVGDLESVKPNLVWTEGHIWTMTAPIKVKDPYFRYKYYMIDKTKDCQHKGWERGIDRIADLRNAKVDTKTNTIYFDDVFE